MTSAIQQHPDDDFAELTASEARAEYYREAGFCRGDADIDFAEEDDARNRAEAAEDERRAREA